MNKELHFSSASEEWETPQDLFDFYHSIYKFTLDAAASSINFKCLCFLTKSVDSLKQKWIGNVWLNPPYGRGIGKWVQKAYESSLEGATVVCLLPSRTDTKWFHDYCNKGDICFIKGRLKFGGHKNNAPFPSMIVVFKGEPK